MADNPLQFRLSINVEGEAFEGQLIYDKPEPRWEIARMLKDVAHRLEAGDDFDTCRNLFDANGNVAGTAALKYKDEHENGRRHFRKV